MLWIRNTGTYTKAFQYRKRQLVCKDRECKNCTAVACGTCANCVHPKRKNKCILRYDRIRGGGGYTCIYAHVRRSDCSFSFFLFLTFFLLI